MLLMAHLLQARDCIEPMDGNALPPESKAPWTDFGTCGFTLGAALDGTSSKD
jgi:hypothetical protein